MDEIIIASTATGISITGRFIFMYLLYTKKSTNIYSLIFSILNIVSSSLWIRYSEMRSDKPLLIRGSSDLILFTISGIYIIYNRIELYKISSSSSGSGSGIELEEIKQCFNSLLK